MIGSRKRRQGVTSRLRLREFDYHTPGYYFVTICANKRQHLFGRIEDIALIPTPAGDMVDALWQGVATQFPGVEVDCHVTMPNHVHAVVSLGLDPELPSAASLVDVLHWYKSMSTTMCIRGVRDQGWPRFDKRLWESGYHDHVVRNDRDLDRIRDYVASNPALWKKDVSFG